MVFLTEDQKLAREGMYAVRMDPQFWYDQALERVFEATNEFEVLGPRPGALFFVAAASAARFVLPPQVLGLEATFTEELGVIKKAHRNSSPAALLDGEWLAVGL